jgi:hypothetical protein
MKYTHNSHDWWKKGDTWKNGERPSKLDQTVRTTSRTKA